MALGSGAGECCIHGPFPTELAGDYHPPRPPSSLALSPLPLPATATPSPFRWQRESHPPPGSRGVKKITDGV